MITFKKNTYLRLFISFLLVIIFSILAKAQLKANFTIDKNGGCSPLTVSCTNTSTGTSSQTIYHWDFGNGHTSSLLNAGATYVQEQGYTITLTITDANKSSTQTKLVTVYKRPEISFLFDTTQGCLPVPVNFTATAIPGDGTIANYFWDFGDGKTEQTLSPKIKHTYNFAQSSFVGLSVTNSHGCYTSVQKDAVRVLPAIVAAYNISTVFLCNITDSVFFTNSSTGPGILNYLWDFGDGTTGTEINPSHAYSKKGIYNVKLTVYNNYGCSNTITQSSNINVANITLAFSQPQLICLNSLVTFKDSATKGNTNKKWLIDGVDVSSNYKDSILQYSFQTAGIHKVQLAATFGNCTIFNTQNITVKNLPDIQPFVINIPTYCNLPVTVNFKDSTKDAISWAWVLDEITNAPFSNSQSPAYSFIYPFHDNVFLTVKNSAGCSATKKNYLNIDNIYATIQKVNEPGCSSIILDFSATTNKDSIVSYNWDFGDGSTSILAQPKHDFTKNGNFTITLNFVTNTGCSGIAKYENVLISHKPVANFTSPMGNTICGNTPTVFLSTSTGDFWIQKWSISKSGSTEFQDVGLSLMSTQKIQFTDTGYYNIQLVLVSHMGISCNDTITKINFIKVLPAIPKISGYFNTCDNARNLVKFTENSTNALSWIWDFGDSITQTFNKKQDTVLHTYAKTGLYKVVLTAVNGQCAVKDSVYSPVLLKQSPILSTRSSEVCTNAAVFIQLGNYQLNPDPYFINMYGADTYSIAKFQYGDGSTFNGDVDRIDSIAYWAGWYTNLTASLKKIDASKTSFRAISTSKFFGCNDTSNYVPLKINGPKAGFKIMEGNPCFTYPVTIQDTSLAGSNSAIKTWQWDFGDGNKISANKGGRQPHIYMLPGQYLVQLKVIDSNGCWDNTINYPITYVTHNVNPSGPKAGFTYSPAIVTFNTPITFTNNTNVYKSDNTQYKWLFGDGSSSTDNSPVHIFSGAIIDTVKLISINTFTNCRDTSIQVINIKVINAHFSYTKFYVGANTCPPVMVHFTNISANTLSVAWNFGDGSTADNQNSPSHTYYKPGVYKITMYGYGYNGTKDTTIDSIAVKAPTAILKADKLSGCLSQTIAFKVQAKNATDIVWDFADGRIQQTQDTFAVHKYTRPGLFSPSLILIDSGGCSITANLADTIIIDALTISLKTVNHYCDSAMVLFSPNILSVAADSFHQALTYKWNFGTGNIRDTANVRIPIFNFNNPGKYIVGLDVQSPYGCIKHAVDTILIIKRSKAIINGPVSVCQGFTAQFSGDAKPLLSSLLWNWNFSNGSSSILQNPPSFLFADTGSFHLSLVVVNDGCADTSLHHLVVHAAPTVNTTPLQATICPGNSVLLKALGGNFYSWLPVTGLNNATIAMPLASPIISTIYNVEVTNVFGCKSVDSVNIVVATPFTIKVSGDIAMCAGSNVRLYVTGAYNYNWINVTAGLDNTQIADPVALPFATTTYTVVGYDAYQCFSDTATIHIIVHNLPTLSHLSGIETPIGTPVQLQVTSSADVITWNWLPVDFLSCSKCASPISTPLKPVTYIVTATTQYGCTFSDTIAIKLTCSISQVYVPNIFSPNGDGKNDVFYIHGNGIKTVKFLQVFNRWGQIVFYKAESNAGDQSAGWDGNINNSPATAGTYVYLAELVCSTGEVLPIKGTVVLVR